jgi:hypothetical protein
MLGRSKATAEKAKGIFAKRFISGIDIKGLKEYY